jgi:hypothetical protein
MSSREDRERSESPGSGDIWTYMQACVTAQKSQRRSAAERKMEDVHRNPTESQKQVREMAKASHDAKGSASSSSYHPTGHYGYQRARAKLLSGAGVSVNASPVLQAIDPTSVAAPALESGLGTRPRIKLDPQAHPHPTHSLKPSPGQALDTRAAIAGSSVEHVAAAHGINVSTVHRWQAEALARPASNRDTATLRSATPPPPPRPSRDPRRRPPGTLPLPSQHAVILPPASPAQPAQTSVVDDLYTAEDRESAFRLLDDNVSHEQIEELTGIPAAITRQWSYGRKTAEAVGWRPAVENATKKWPGYP